MVKNKFKFPKSFLTNILRITASPPTIKSKRISQLFGKNNIFCLLLIVYCLLAFTNTTYSTIRYVSHQGSNSPPYLTWKTAADSIMSAINISVFGDTIYVANGVYEEQVIMIPGLTFIGGGMDSTIIDTRALVTPSFWALHMADSCIIKNFQVLVSDEKMGGGIVTAANVGLVEMNMIKNTSLSIMFSNSNTIVIDNWLIETNDGIFILGLLRPSNPKIISNYIKVNDYAIDINFAPELKPEIYNNIIYLSDDFASGYQGSLSDTVKIYNNLIIAENGEHIIGISNSNVPTLTINNYVNGNYEYGIGLGGLNLVENNVTTSGDRGFSVAPGNTIVKYNNSWNNEMNYYNFTPDSTNLSVDPMVVNEDSLDFHLQMFSPLIDAGDPDILDIDGSRSDIGLYGGPFGERYKYLDLAPKPPRNLSATIDSNFITLFWNPNTEADFNSYNMFRDTTANFTADSTTFVASLTDTFYIQIIPDGIDAFYYKLTAMDNQGNESNPSEELAVIITSVNEYPATVSNYQLYQNYPNPFNPSTKIAYKLEERGYVKLMVYDIKGELVDVLVNQVQEAGYYEVEFFAEVGSRKSAVGNRLASGIYIYQIMIKSENNIPVFTDMKKMMMIK